MIKILFVDDEFQLLDIAKVFLGGFKDLDVDTSSSAKDAIEKLRTTAYDVIVSDYQMPDMNGIEFLKLIRSLDNPLPFILFTGKGREEVVIEALNAGADFYLQKGENPQAQFIELANMVEKAVQKRVAIYGDDTRREKADSDLRMMRYVFNESIAAMGIADDRRIMTHVNDAFLRYLCYNGREEVIGRPISDFMSDRGETELILKQLDLQGKWEGNYQARRKDGSTLIVHGLTIVLKDENGRPIGYHSTAIDTTGQKISQEAGPTTGVKLNLLSNITVHDIQNQVVVLNGLIHKAKHANSQIQTREYLSRIQQVADKIQSHVAFARDYQNLGKAPPLWIRLDISVQDLTSKFDSKWVQFEIELGTLEVFSDAMLNRAFYNLIDDTLKHGQKATKIKFSAMTRGEDLILLYEDNGVGVPIDRKRNIFEKPPSSQKVHGLVLVKEILAITGMTIVENGVPGKGARFEILVPKGNFRYAGNEKA